MSEPSADDRQSLRGKLPMVLPQPRFSCPTCDDARAPHPAAVVPTWRGRGNRCPKCGRRCLLVGVVDPGRDVATFRDCPKCGWVPVSGDDAVSLHPPLDADPSDTL